MDIQLPVRKPGKIGDKLKRRIKAHQQSRGFKADGLVGNQTAGGMLDEIEARQSKMLFMAARFDALSRALEECQANKGQCRFWGGLGIVALVIGVAALLASF